MLLALFAVLGLLGQEAAWASAQFAAAEQPQASQSMAGCDEMMGHAPMPKKSPCSGTMECMIAMGCLPAMMLRHVDTPAAEPLVETTVQFWPPTVVLVGDDLKPELDPPTYLA